MQKVETTNKLDDFFKKHRWKFVVFSIIIGSILSALLFDLKLSTGGDDSNYILSAQKFINGENFPTWHGSFYPIFLSFFIRIFGINILILKILSYIMIIIQLFVIYYAFRKKIPWTVLVLTMIFSSVCLEILYFGGQTYSEALYMLLQISTIAAFYKLYDKQNSNPNISQKKLWKEWITFGFLIFLSAQTRNIGWSLLIASILFFLLDKKKINALFSLISFLIFFIPYNIYKMIFWNIKNAGFEGQFKRMFWINPYNANDGIISFNNLISRTWDNANLYFSKHFLIILGWKETTSTNTIITLVIILILISSFIIIAQKRKPLLFVTFYTYIAIAITFITQQVMWDQVRLISIFVPLIIIIISTAFWDYFIPKNKKHHQFIIILFFLLIIIPTFTKTINIAKKHYPILKANLQGDDLYGYTTDWQHYLQIAKWTAENIPENEKVACRVPGLAFVYGNGREFEGIYNFKSYNIDNVLDTLERKYKNNYVFDYTEDKQNINSLFPFFKYISSIINLYNGTQYIIISMNDSINKEFTPILTNSNIIYYKLDNLKNITTINKSDNYAVYPDTLLEYLTERNIDFLISANIRKDPTQKTNEFITTIHLYIYFLELKYPGMFNLVWQAGSDNDEPATLFKINYNVQTHGRASQ